MSLPPGEPPSAGAVSGLKRRTARAVLAVGFKNIAVRLLGLAGTLVLARLLAPADFGLLALGYTIVSVSHLVSGGGGLGAGLIRRNAPPTHQELGATLGFQLLLALLIAGSVTGVALVIGDKTVAVAAIMVWSIPLSIVRVPDGIVLTRELDFGLPTTAEIAEITLYNVIAIAAVSLGAGVWGVAVAAAVQSGLGSAIYLIRGPVGPMRPRLDFALVRPTIRYGLKFQANEAARAARDHGVSITIAAVAGTTALGIWSLAFRLFQSVFLVLETLWRVLFPAMARLEEAGAEIRPLLSDAMRLSGLTIGLLAAALGGMAPALIPTLFGDAWLGTVPLLPLGAAALFIAGPVSTAFVGLLYARGAAGVVARTTLAEATVWIAVIVAGGTTFGPVTAAVGMVAGAPVVGLSLARAIDERARPRILRSLGPSCIAALAAGSAGWLTTQEVQSAPVATFASGAIVCIVYVAVMAVLRRSDFRLALRVVGSLRQ